VIKIEQVIEEVQLGWVNKPKGLLQILWECGWIYPQEPLSRYTKDKCDMWLDENGELLPEFVSDFKKYSLTYILSECPDFKYEKSGLEQLAVNLLAISGCRIQILFSPKYHCELAGKGIKYAWGLAKKVLPDTTCGKKGKR